VIDTPFHQIARYDRYVTRRSPFDTHQGVKGLEFPRVMVIIDDEQARGFMFSYDKLFGTKMKSESDFKNESQGQETTIDRTRRLFYVTCSRAENSLAIMAYSSDAARLKARVVAEEWFQDDEVELIP
jgi:DNA helicase-2/ATP-dependent DNA helicase PcrA